MDLLPVQFVCSSLHCQQSQFSLGHTLFGRKSIVAATFRFYKQAYFIGSGGSIFKERPYNAF